MSTTAITSMPGFVNRYTSMPGLDDTGRKALCPVSYRGPP
eukprot:COSAG02_NODE_43548_length_372_cov_4.810219_1_plen_39_part_10